MIELKNIKKYYKMGDNVVKALDGVSLKVEDGEFVTIIGPSGSGKSTLMNIIGCLDEATEGEYFVDDVEISKYSENQLAFLRNKKMGFIFQGFNLLQNLSAYENVELPLIYQGISISERKKIVVSALEMVGMKERMKHRPSELSGGQQQRVAIARALATKPMCILADEPTGNLDTATGDEIMKILKELNEAGTTVIIITHNDEIAKQSRRVVRILDGKIESDLINKNISSFGESTRKTDAIKQQKTDENEQKVNEKDDLKIKNNEIDMVKTSSEKTIEKSLESQADKVSIDAGESENKPTESGLIEQKKVKVKSKFNKKSKKEEEK